MDRRMVMESGGIENLIELVPGSRKRIRLILKSTNIRSGDKIISRISLVPYEADRELLSSYIDSVEYPKNDSKIVFSMEKPEGQCLMKDFNGIKAYAPVEPIIDDTLYMISRFIDFMENRFDVTVDGLEYFMHPDSMPEHLKNRGKVLSLKPENNSPLRYDTRKTAYKHPFVIQQ